MFFKFKPTTITTYNYNQTIFFSLKIILFKVFYLLQVLIFFFWYKYKRNKACKLLKTIQSFVKPLTLYYVYTNENDNDDAILQSLRSPEDFFYIYQVSRGSWLYFCDNKKKKKNSRWLVEAIPLSLLLLLFCTTNWGGEETIIIRVYILK